MLGGLSPIMIFTFPLDPTKKSPLFNAISGIPLVGETLAKNIGLPIPIYFDPGLTGIEIESESKSIDIQTDPYGLESGKTPRVIQTPLNSTVTINMIAQKSSLILTVILALSEIIFQKVVSQEYSITYLNGPTLVLKGLLHQFTTNAGVDDDLIRISMQIVSKREGDIYTKIVPTILPNPVAGAIPG